jgi:NADP-dependent aldehyde dehydrogenase
VFGLRDAGFGEFQKAVGHLIEGAAPVTMLHAGICASYHQGLARASKLGGVELLGRATQEADPRKTHGEPVVLCTDAEHFRKHPELTEEVFGPFAVLVSAQTMTELEEIANNLEGQLTATVHGSAADFQQAGRLLKILQRKAGRLLINGFPTGVEVCPSMNHGGPYPATTDSRFTSVGTAALYRFVRPVCYQSFPQSLLPAALQNENPSGLWRLVNGKLSRDVIGTSSKDGE